MNAIQLDRAAFSKPRFMRWKGLWICSASHLSIRAGRLVCATGAGETVKSAYADWVARVSRFVGEELA